METYIVNDQIVPVDTIQQMETQYGIKCIPGNYWYDKRTGAFGMKGGPCTGLGLPNLQIGGPLKADASAGNTGVFINGRELHAVDVQGLQTIVPVLPGRYWMDAFGSFGFERFPVPVGNIYHLYQMKFSSRNTGGSSSYHKSNPWSGETTSFGSDDSFMYYSSKKPDGTTIDYYCDL